MEVGHFLLGHFLPHLNFQLPGAALCDRSCGSQEIRPGIVTKEMDNVQCRPIKSRDSVKGEADRARLSEIRDAISWKLFAGMCWLVTRHLGKLESHIVVAHLRVDFMLMHDPKSHEVRRLS